MRLLHRLRVLGDVPEAVVVALEGGEVAGPRGLVDLDALFGAPVALLKVDADSLELLDHPADADTQHEPAVREVIHGHELARVRERMPVRRDEHAGPELQRRGLDRDGAHDDGTVQHVVAALVGALAGHVRGVEALRIVRHADMVGIPDRVNARALGGERHLDRVHLLHRRVVEEHVHVVAIGLTVGVSVKPDFHDAAPFVRPSTGAPRLCRPHRLPGSIVPLTVASRRRLYPGA